MRCENDDPIFRSHRSVVAGVLCGLTWLRKPGNYFRLENRPYMRLVIEDIGEGPRGLPAIALADYYEQDGYGRRTGT